MAAAPGGGGGGGGGFGGLGALGGVGGGGAGGGGATGANSVRQYTNSTMLGDAMITSDMDSRNLIVVTDEKTYQIIKAIVADLDKPRPQVLIDCVFVQVTLTNELDLGTEMTYTGPVGIKTNPSGTATTQFGIGLTNTTGAANANLPDLGSGLLTTAPRSRRPSLQRHGQQQRGLLQPGRARHQRDDPRPGGRQQDGDPLPAVGADAQQPAGDDPRRPGDPDHHQLLAGHADLRRRSTRSPSRTSASSSR